MMERYADVLDLAQAHAEHEVATRIAAIQLRTRQGEGRDDCLDCGVRIPEARRHHVPNALRCAPCQDKAELSAKGAPFRGKI
jgi:RNA polymerase-binding transcription factor DksA